MKKPRQPKKARSLETLNMLLTCKGGSHRNSRNKRTAQKERRVEQSAW